MSSEERCALHAWDEYSRFLNFLFLVAISRKTRNQAVKLRCNMNNSAKEIWMQRCVFWIL